jgi:hypothetical protein
VLGGAHAAVGDGSLVDARVEPRRGDHIGQGRQLIEQVAECGELGSACLAAREVLPKESPLNDGHVIEDIPVDEAAGMLT